MRRLIVMGAASLLLCGFALTPDYQQQARDEVAFCVGFAQRDFPSFEAAVRAIDPATGEVAIDRLNPNGRAEPTFTRCLMAIRKWRLVERHIPRTVDPTPPPVPYAGTGPLTRLRTSRRFQPFGLVPAQVGTVPKEPRSARVKLVAS